MNISFFETQAQVLAQTKDVTRRLGWRWLVAACARGERPRLQPIVKGQGLRKGEQVRKLGPPIWVKSARFEPLNALTGGSYTDRMAKRECVREGFPELSPRQFVEFFCRFNVCPPEQEVVRIEFEYEE